MFFNSASTVVERDYFMQGRRSTVAYQGAFGAASTAFGLGFGVDLWVGFCSPRPEIPLL